MLDSPYVRRVAIALLRLGLGFEHRPLSLFRDIDAFRAINPVLKAPTFIADDGTILMDSSLIIDYAQSLAPHAPRLTPAAPAARLTSYRLNGLGLAVSEKAVQLHYERSLRPPERQHEPWRQRVLGQLAAGLEGLEREAMKAQNWLVDKDRCWPTSPSPRPSLSLRRTSPTLSLNPLIPRSRPFARAPKLWRSSAPRPPRTASKSPRPSRSLRATYFSKGRSDPHVRSARDDEGGDHGRSRRT